MSFVIISSYSRTKLITKLSIPIIILIFTIQLINVKTDLPVHCKREEIEGEWVFRINSESFNPNFADFRSTCGHGFPDKIEKLESDINFAFDDFRDLQIFLGQDYKVYDPVSNEVKGKWTPVYDEGFIVHYEKSVFTVFMKYHLKPNIHSVNSKKSSSAKALNKDYLSNCQKTMIGWFIVDESQNTKNWSCFFGFKKSIESEFNYLSSSRNKGFFNINTINDTNSSSDNNFSNSNSLPKKVLKPNKSFSAFRYFYYNKKTRKYDKENDDDNDNDNNFIYDTEESLSQKKSNFAAHQKSRSLLNNKINNVDRNGFVNINFDLLDSLDTLENNSFLEMKTQSKHKITAKLEHFKYEDQIELINEINSNNLSWRAKIHEDFKGFSFMDLKMKLGLRDSKEGRSLSDKPTKSKKPISEARFKEMSPSNFFMSISFNILSFF